MKNWKLLIFFIAIISVLSCDEDFNPYGDFTERYAFTCILKSDVNFQTATLFRSFRPDGFDPYSFTKDPSILGADIRVWYDGSVFIFKDSSVIRQDSSRYNTPFNFYYNDQFQIENRKTIELEVLLPNGRRLRSASFTPAKINYENKSDVTIPAGTKDIIQIFWLSIDKDIFFFPKLSIRYRQKVNGEIVDGLKDVPLRYLNHGGESVPVYPVPNSATTVVYDINAIKIALQEISINDPQKQNYSVYQKLAFELVAYDLPTTRYISSTGGRIDDLTVSVDVADYTNIEGGFGLFGSYSKRDYTKLRFLQEFIDAFGYNFINEN
jgi:hypothetical protein